MKRYAKFGVLCTVIVGTLAWLATAGIGESKTYYKTIPEVNQMRDSAAGKKRLRVAGDVEKDSIVRKGHEVAFTIVGENQKLRVIYAGAEPLPDTFRDGAQALADGKLGSDGVFHASKIQAKCASKYGVKPGEKVDLETRRTYEKQTGKSSGI
ncbi:MAG: cytochrome c maturation protein CcmE [Bryobacteraceae bacterium]